MQLPLRAAAAYWILLSAMRLIGRRTTSQMASFDLIGLFLFGGITITASSIATFVMIMPASVEAAGQWSQAQLVTVLMVDNQFQPDHLTFRAHQPYQLRLENHGKQMHEFTAPAFLRSSTVRDKKLLSNGGMDIVVQPGQSVNVFLYPPSKGEYVLTCADHDWDGMVGGIVVE